MHQSDLSTKYKGCSINSFIYIVLFLQIAAPLLVKFSIAWLDNNLWNWELIIKNNKYLKLVGTISSPFLIFLRDFLRILQISFQRTTKFFDQTIKLKLVQVCLSCCLLFRTFLKSSAYKYYRNNITVIKYYNRYKK